MKLVSIVLVGLFLLQGCNRGCWDLQGKTQSEFQQDNLICDYEAKKASYTPMGTFDSPIGAGMQEGLQYNRIYEACMLSKGYRITKTGCP